jgi:hypothetical protein
MDAPGHEYLNLIEIQGSHENRVNLFNHGSIQPTPKRLRIIIHISYLCAFHD